MGPFHIIYRFKFGEGYIWIEQLEFWRRPVFIEFGLPFVLIRGWQAPCDWFPFCDTQPVSLQWIEATCDTLFSYPDSVSLVRPPKTTIPKTLAALPKSQYPTDFVLVWG